MKEENGSQDVGATAFDYSNSIAPQNYNDIHYGNRYVPKPTNHAAKEVSASAVMNAVLRAK